MHSNRELQVKQEPSWQLIPATNRYAIMLHDDKIVQSNFEDSIPSIKFQLHLDSQHEGEVLAELVNALDKALNNAQVENSKNLLRQLQSNAQLKLHQYALNNTQKMIFKNPLLIVSGLIKILDNDVLEKISDKNSVKPLLLQTLLCYLEMAFIEKNQEKNDYIPLNQKLAYQAVFTKIENFIKSDDIESRYALDCCVAVLQALPDEEKTKNIVTRLAKQSGGDIGGTISVIADVFAEVDRNRNWYSDVFYLRRMLPLAKRSVSLMEKLQSEIKEKKLLASKHWQVIYTIQEIWCEIATSSEIHHVQEMAASMGYINIVQLTQHFLLSDAFFSQHVGFRYRLIKSLLELGKHAASWLKQISFECYDRAYQNKNNQILFDCLSQQPLAVNISQSPHIMIQVDEWSRDEKAEAMLCAIQQVTSEERQILTAYLREFSVKNRQLIEKSVLDRIENAYLLPGKFSHLSSQEVIARLYLLHRIAFDYNQMGYFDKTKSLYKAIVPVLRALPLVFQQFFHLQAGDNFSPFLEEYIAASDYYHQGLALTKNTQGKFFSIFNQRLEYLLLQLLCYSSYEIAHEQIASGRLDLSTDPEENQDSAEDKGSFDFFKPIKNWTYEDYARFFKKLKPLLNLFIQNGYSQGLEIFKKLLKSHLANYLRLCINKVERLENDLADNEKCDEKLNPIKAFVVSSIKIPAEFWLECNYHDFVQLVCGSLNNYKSRNLHSWIYDKVITDLQNKCNKEFKVFESTASHKKDLEKFKQDYYRNLSRIQLESPSADYLLQLDRLDRQVYSWIHQQFDKIQLLLGSAPCGFELVCLRDMSLPYIDPKKPLHLMLLIEQESAYHHIYFQSLLRLGGFLVNQLGGGEILQIEMTHLLPIPGQPSAQHQWGTLNQFIQRINNDELDLPMVPLLPIVIRREGKDNKFWDNAHVLLTQALQNNYLIRTISTNNLGNNPSVTASSEKKQLNNLYSSYNLYSSDIFQSKTPALLPIIQFHVKRLFNLKLDKQPNEKARQAYVNIILETLYLSLAPVKKNHFFYNKLSAKWQDYSLQLKHRRLSNLELDKQSDEKSIKAYIDVILETLCLSLAPAHQHYAFYIQLCKKWQDYYYNQLEDWLAKPTKSLVWQDALMTLAVHPDTLGNRKIISMKQKSLQSTLIQLTEEKHADEKKAVSNLSLRWIENNGKEIKYYERQLHSAIKELWQRKEIINKEHKIQEKARTLTDGRRIVIPLSSPAVKDNDVAIAYARFYPEMPGCQALAQSLAWRISGYGLVGGLVRLTPNPKEPFAYPVYISLAAGKTLQQILEQEGSLDRIEKALDPKSFTLKVLETLLLGYEDDKLDNQVPEEMRSPNGDIRYRIISIDPDRAFDTLVVGRKISKSNVNYKEVKVNCKSVVFCMSAMKDKLNAEAVAEFLSLDPLQLIKAWLTEQEKYDQLHNERPATSHKDAKSAAKKQEAIKSLFSIKEAQKFFEQKTDECYLTGAFASGAMSQLYQRWLRLRAVLQNIDDFPNDHFDMIRCVEPFLCKFYEDVWPQGTPDKRFAALPTGYQIIAAESLLSTSAQRLDAKQIQAIQKRQQGMIDNHIVLTCVGLFSASGASCLVKRKVDNKFIPDTHKRDTVISTISLSYGERSANLEILDMPSPLSRMDDYTPNNPLTRSDIIIIAISVADYLDKNALESLISEIIFNSSSPAPILLVGTKIDSAKRIFSYEEGLALAKQLNCDGYMECSAKTGEGVDKLFNAAVHLAYTWWSSALPYSGLLPVEAGIAFLDQKTFDLRPYTQAEIEAKIKNVNSFFTPTKDEKANKQPAHHLVKYQSSNIVRQRALATLTITGTKLGFKEALHQGQFHYPSQAQVELDFLDIHRAQVKYIRQAMIEGITRPFEELGNAHFIKELVINGIQFEKVISTPRYSAQLIQRRILHAMIGSQFLHLHLANCQALTNDLLLQILKTSPDLLTLDISGCKKITGKAVQDLCDNKYCQQLEKLYLNDLPGINQLIRVNWRGKQVNAPLIFPHLRRLSLQNCRNLTRINIDAAHIQTVLFDGTPQYEALGAAWTRLDIEEDILTYIRDNESQLEQLNKDIEAIPQPDTADYFNYHISMQGGKQSDLRIYEKKIDILTNLLRYNEAINCFYVKLKYQKSIIYFLKTGFKKEEIRNKIKNHSTFITFRVALLDCALSDHFGNYHLINLLFLANRHEAALALIETNEIKSVSLNCKANIFYQLKRYVEAADCFVRAINEKHFDLKVLKHSPHYLLPREGKQASLAKLQFWHEAVAQPEQSTLDVKKALLPSHITINQQWQQIAVLIAFMRINHKSPLRYSIMAYLPWIMKMTAETVINPPLPIVSKPVVTRSSFGQDFKSDQINIGQLATVSSQRQINGIFPLFPPVKLIDDPVSLQGTFNKRKISFDKFQSKGDGRCGFYSIAMLPDEVVEALLRVKDNTAVRQFLADEIVQEIKKDILGKNEKNWQSEDLHDQKLPNDLVVAYSAPHNKHDAKAQEKGIAIELQLKQYASQSLVYCKYVNSLKKASAWLGCKSAKLAAQNHTMPFSLCIWERDEKNPSPNHIKLREQDSYINSNLVDMKHIYYTGTHFDFLVEKMVKPTSTLTKKGLFALPEKMKLLEPLQIDSEHLIQPLR